MTGPQNRLDVALYGWGVWLSQLDGVVWSAAAAAGLEQLPAQAKTKGKKQQQGGGGPPCGYVGLGPARVQS